MSVKYSMLLGKIREKGYSQERLAREIGLSAVSLNAKLQKKVDFKQREISSICAVLDIPRVDIPLYFF